MRKKGWEQALHRTCVKAMRKAYRWGEQDCALFAADCVLAMTGKDFAKDYRGKYDSEESANEMLASLKCESIGDLPGIHLIEITPSLAQRGDIVLMPGELGEFLAVCDGRTAVGPVPRGLQHNPMSIATRAWRVD